jgi:hypothetical protein
MAIATNKVMVKRKYLYSCMVKLTRGLT